MESKVIVITGASSGIGAALAQELGDRGHRLVLAARRTDKLQQVARASGPSALAFKTDVCIRTDVERLRDRALEAFERIDVWVNNAGRGIGRPVEELTDDDVDEMMRVNLKSALYGMQAILPHFKKRGEGHIINISTVLSRVPFATYRSAYCAAKSALNMLTADLRMDLRQTHPGIHVSLVLPGVVTTEFAANALHGTPPARPGAGSSQGRPAEETAVAIADLIATPRPELYTNPALAGVALTYYRDVEKFEENLGKQAPH